MLRYCWTSELAPSWKKKKISYTQDDLYGHFYIVRFCGNAVKNQVPLDVKKMLL